MARKKTIIDPVSVTVTVSTKYLEHLKRISVRISMQQGKIVTVSEAIRAVLENAYPMPKTSDLFEMNPKETFDLKKPTTLKRRARTNAKTTCTQII